MSQLADVNIQSNVSMFTSLYYFTYCAAISCLQWISEQNYVCLL